MKKRIKVNKSTAFPIFRIEQEESIKTFIFTTHFIGKLIQNSVRGDSRD